ncbi:hypothetical protein [Nocardiopsis kunsanensis]|uniref:hypothetical protein n=1 Tax=Nocardiopsis kunsanensis TaxID=141693 RepID=UPI0003492E36|nr:hypothetical protein [Nocardiopsis kunsanensis]
MSTRSDAARVRIKAVAANRAAEPGSLEFKAASSLAAALYVTDNLDRARALITRARHTNPTTRTTALDLLHQLTEEENTTQ